MVSFQKFLHLIKIDILLKIPNKNLLRHRIFAVGCQILEGSNLSFNKEKQFYGNMMQVFQQLAGIKDIQTCWLIFPITREQQVLFHIKNMMKATGKQITETRLRNIETKQVYTLLKNVTISKGSVIDVVDIVSGM